jgi:hypothetical protein
MHSKRTERELILLLLPRLKPDCDVKTGDRAGQWDAQPSQAFAKVASSLDYRAPGAVKSISAVPTMWARPLLMEMALHNQSHPLRGQAIPQWQGMLAALALAEVRGFPLKAELLELEKLRYEDFGNCLVELLPDPANALYTSDNKHPWEDVYVFLWDKKPVGMSSPSTLVVPSEQANWTKLPWWNERDKVLLSPHTSLNESEKSLLCRWLEHLRQELNRHQGRRNAVNIMGGLIDEFRASLKVNPDRPLSLSNDPQFFGVPLNRGVLNALNRPVRVEEKESNVRLIPSPDKEETLPLLIIDPDMASVWNIPPQNIWVHGGKTLASLKVEDLRSGRLIWQDVRWLEVKDLFLPEFVFIDQEDALPGGFLPREIEPLSFNGQRITPLLPLNSILLDYFTPEDLGSKVQFQPIKGTEGSFVRVILDLPLSGVKGDRAFENYRLYKDYPLKEENALPQTPVLEVWPHFRSQDWKEYYAFYYDGSYRDKTFQVTLPSVSEVNSFSFGEGSYQIVRLENFPSFIECKDFQNTPVGLILLRTPEEIPRQGSWKVGVDFGTSFTNIYIHKNDVPKPEPLHLENLMLAITTHKNETRIPVLFEYFIPESFVPDSKPLPLSSVLTTRGNRTTKSGEAKVILDGRVYIPRMGGVSAFRPQEQWIQTDLKWSTQNNELFLQHLALHIAALAAKNGVREIHWCLSYPSAFARRDKNRYTQTWKDLTERLNKQTGISQICDSKNDFRTESLAAAQYFKDQERHRLVKTTCIDLGGGTSDLSIWEENKPIYQCSLQLAGRDLFSQFLEMNLPFIERYFEINLSEWVKLRGGTFNAKLDVWLRLNGTDWLKKQRVKLDEEKDVQGLIRIMAIGMAGLYYYIGYLLKVLHQEGKYRHSEITEVYAGGNGSRLLHWLSETGQFDRNSEVNLLLSRMLSQGSGFEDSEVTTRLSQNPKDEVACGLVWDETQLLEISREYPLIAGEACTINGKSFDNDSHLDLSHLDLDEEEIVTVDIPELVQLSQFFDEFHAALKQLRIKSIKPLPGYNGTRDFDRNKKLWSEVKTELKNLLLEVKGKAEEVRLQPPFILGLKALLKVLGRQWSEK